MAGGDVRDQAEDQQQQQGGQEGGEEEEGDGEAKEAGENKGKKKQENNNGKKNKNNQNNNNKNQKQAARSPLMMARSFVQLRGLGSKYNQYQFNFLMLEASNLLTLLAQLLVCMIAIMEISHVEMKCLR